MEKTLIVYVKDSYYKYHRLFVDYLYEIDENNILTIYSRNSLTGEEIENARFRNWDYLIIDNGEN